jgi:hypothetical protein
MRRYVRILLVILGLGDVDLGAGAVILVAQELQKHDATSQYLTTTN